LWAFLPQNRFENRRHSDLNFFRAVVFAYRHWGRKTGLKFQMIFVFSLFLKVIIISSEDFSF
jgi:hypothetical protein